MGELRTANCLPRHRRSSIFNKGSGPVGVYQLMVTPAQENDLGVWKPNQWPPHSKTFSLCSPEYPLYYLQVQAEKQPTELENGEKV